MSLAQARAELEARRFAEAWDLAASVASTDPRQGEAWHVLGVAAAGLGDNRAAELHLARAAALKPHDGIIARNYGAVLARQKRLPEATREFERALLIDPGDSEAAAMLAKARGSLGQQDDAVSILKAALAKSPGNIDLMSRLANLLARRPVIVAGPGGFDERRALLLDLARELERDGRLSEAEARYNECLTLGPDPGLEVRRALLLPPIPADEAEIASRRRGLAERLDTLAARPIMLSDSHAQVRRTAFYLAYHHQDDRPLQEQIARFHLKTSPTLAWQAPHIAGWQERPAGEKLKIGFASAQFRMHTIGRLNRGLIQHMPRDKFEVSVIRAPGPRDDFGGTIDKAADRVIELPKNLAAAREAIAAAELDLLFYTDIGMEALTYYLAFARLAPVQCVTWGHPVTTGIPAMDYFVSGADFEPADGERHYSERLVRLANPGIYYDRPSHEGGRLPQLPEDCTIYACLQTLFKFHPSFDALIAEILRRDPRGRLFLVEGARPSLGRQLRDRFDRSIPDVAQRIHFLPHLDYPNYMAMLARADCILDTTGFGGGSTSLEAFHLARPIVTWPAPYLRGRLTYGFCRRMGILDTVADSARRYVEIAVRLANDRAWRDSLRSRIEAASPVLFENADGPAELARFFAAAIDAARKGVAVSGW
jgi:protein O-GlcNAc transferase